jgi:hypothetical protein
MANPLGVLQDVQNPCGSEFSPALRNRNLVLHGGRTDAVGCVPFFAPLPHLWVPAWIALFMVGLLRKSGQ